MEITTLIITQLFAGLSRASVLFLLSSGLSLIFGVNKVINFMHGSLYLMGMYLSFTLVTKVITSTFGFWINLILAPMFIAAIAALIEVIFFRRVYEKEHLMQMVLASGLVYIMGDTMKFVWGPIAKAINLPPGFDGSFVVAGIVLPKYFLLVIAIGWAFAVSLWVIIQKTRFGREMRASATDPNTTKALGVNVSAVKTSVFALGSFMAAFAGALNLPLSAASLGADLEATILAFIIVIIGGVGSMFGSFVAALVVGIAEAFGIMFLPQFTIVLIYFIMVIILLTRPYGILGRVT